MTVIRNPNPTVSVTIKKRGNKKTEGGHVTKKKSEGGHQKLTKRKRTVEIGKKVIRKSK